MFVSRKLRHIYDVFKQKPELGYYHHLAYVIDSQNRVIGGFFGGPQRMILVNPSDVDNVKRVLRRYGSFGSLMSTTAIRREAIEPFIDKLRLLISGPDTFMFFAALNSRYLMLHEPFELSYYRVHGDQVSLPRGSTSIDTLRRFALSAVLNQHSVYYLRNVFPQLSLLPLRHNLLGAYHYNVLGLILLGLNRKLVSSTSIIVLWRSFFDKSPWRVLAGLLGITYIVLPRRVAQYLLVKYYYR